jgi:hypothetical protein
MTTESITDVNIANIVNNEDDISVEGKHKVLVLYFEDLDRIGVPYGLNELIKKSRELGLPIPSRKEIKSWKRKYLR